MLTTPHDWTIYAIVTLWVLLVHMLVHLLT